MAYEIKPNEIDECVKDYMKSIKDYKSLTKENEHELLYAYKHHHDLNARNKLITSNLKYTCKLANRYRGSGIPLSSLISEANNALLYAIDKFDEKQDVKIISYAQWWINQRITNLINNNYKMPLDDLPTEHEEQMLSDNADFSNEYSYEENYENNAFVEEEVVVNEIEAKVLVERLYNKINKREQDMLNMRYGLYPYEKEYTLEEIGFKYNLTKERVRQIIERSMLKLRSEAMLSDCSYFSK